MDSMCCVSKKALGVGSQGTIQHGFASCSMGLLTPPFVFQSREHNSVIIGCAMQHAHIWCMMMVHDDGMTVAQRDLPRITSAIKLIIIISIVATGNEY